METSGNIHVEIQQHIRCGAAGICPRHIPQNHDNSRVLQYLISLWAYAYFRYTDYCQLPTVPPPGPTPLSYCQSTSVIFRRVRVRVFN